MKWMLVAIVVCATTGGELFQTLGMKQHGEIHDFRFGALGRAFGRVIQRPHIIAGVLLMAVSFFAFMSLLSVADLSFAVPATAASYVLETVLARLVLRERINRLRWTGALLVACGVALVSL